jgi:hypothetical protein
MYEILPARLPAEFADRLQQPRDALDGLRSLLIHRIAFPIADSLPET